jgi:hypothetical protein
MAIKFEKVLAGSILLDVRRVSMGNTTMRHWACWDVVVDKIDHDKRYAIVRWNICNRPERVEPEYFKKLYLTPPKAYREQQERKGYAVREGRLGPEPPPNSPQARLAGKTYRCQFCEIESPTKEWRKNNSNCPNCGRVYDAILAQEGDD